MHGRNGMKLLRTLVADARGTLMVEYSLILAVAAPGLDPKAHVYPATMWALAVWTAAHCVAGATMQIYCLAGSLAGKLTPRHNADLWNTTLFWHFQLGSGLVTAAMIGLLPRAL